MLNYSWNIGINSNISDNISNNMRFSLRNQRKISDTYGKAYLDKLMESLKEHFISDDIKEYSSDSVNLKYINTGKFEFYITRKMFDVYNLAYKGAVGFEPKVIKKSVDDTELRNRIKELEGRI